MSTNEIPLNQVQWEIHETHPELVQPLRDKLAEVSDPEIGLNILQLGLIRKVAVKDNEMKIFMILTTPFCPYGPEMLETTRKKAQEATSLDVVMELGMEPWDFSLMEDPGAIDWGMYP